MAFKETKAWLKTIANWAKAIFWDKVSDKDIKDYNDYTKTHKNEDETSRSLAKKAWKSSWKYARAYNDYKDSKTEYESARYDNGYRSAVRTKAKRAALKK